jgi:hypothetical protein
MNTITELVGKNYPVMTYALSESTTSVNNQYADAVNEKNAVISVLSSCNTNVRNEIQKAATALSGYQTIYSDFGSYDSTRGWPYDSSVTTGDPGNLNHWVINTVESISVSGLSTSGASAFSCFGDETGHFPSGSTMLWLDEDENKWARVLITETKLISGATSGSEDDMTYVSVSAESLGYTIPSGITDICTIIDTYNYSSSYITTNYPNIATWSNKFLFALDHLTLPLNSSSGGTYGLNAKVGALSLGSASVAANKTKQDLVDYVYREFTTWTPVTSTASYVSVNSFLCPGGDMTSEFPSGTDLLIDMGIDNEVGCVVSASEYIPAWRSTYTEATVVLNVSGYIYSPATSALPLSAVTFSLDEDLISVSVSSHSGITPIPGAIYQDPVTIIWPGDITSTIPSGSTLICEFSSGDTEYFTPRYFTVYHVELEHDIRAGKTLVTVQDGLPLTENVWQINKWN